MLFAIVVIPAKDLCARGWQKLTLRETGRYADGGQTFDIQVIAVNKGKSVKRKRPNGRGRTRNSTLRSFPAAREDAVDILSKRNCVLIELKARLIVGGGVTTPTPIAIDVDNGTCLLQQSVPRAEYCSTPCRAKRS